MTHQTRNKAISSTKAEQGNRVNLPASYHQSGISQGEVPLQQAQKLQNYEKHAVVVQENFCPRIIQARNLAGMQPLVPTQHCFIQEHLHIWPQRQKFAKCLNSKTPNPEFVKLLSKHTPLPINLSACLFLPTE